MKTFPLIVMMTLVGGVAAAQTRAPVTAVQTGIGEESLAPLPLKPSVPPAAATSATVAAAEVVDPFVVKGVVATLSGTTGFDRDAALEVAARQALPEVMERMGIAADKAKKNVKSLGNAMRFVNSYKVVKETLIPTYVLTADLTFNGPMLLKNFGGKMPVMAPAEVSGTAVPVEVEAVIPASQNQPVKQWVVKISDRDPGVVDKVRVNLSRQANTKATYRLLTSAGAELLVNTPLSADEITRYAGHGVEVLELDIPLPTEPVAVGEHPWQGQAEPAIPAVPGVPAAPNSPAGVY